MDLLEDKMKRVVGNGGIVVAVLFFFGLWATVFYVVAHFVAKFW